MAGRFSVPADNMPAVCLHRGALALFRQSRTHDSPIGSDLLRLLSLYYSIVEVLCT